MANQLGRIEIRWSTMQTWVGLKADQINAVVKVPLFSSPAKWID